MQPLYLYPRPLSLHNGTLPPSVRCGDSSIMRIWEFKTNLPFPAEPKIFPFSAFHVQQCWLAPPLHFVKKLVTARSSFRGNVWGKGRSRKSILKSKIIKKQGRIWFTPVFRIIDPPVTNNTLLSLALDFPHITHFYQGLFPFVRLGGGLSDSKPNVNVTEYVHFCSFCHLWRVRSLLELNAEDEWQLLRKHTVTSTWSCVLFFKKK